MFTMWIIMVDYEKKYLELTSGFMKCTDDVSDEFPEANGFEKSIIALRREGWNYGDIQLKLGMPPKKQIRAVLLKWAPELIDNSKTKIVKTSSSLSELYNIIKSHNNETFNVWGEPWTFFIDDNKLMYRDDGGVWEFSDWDEISQSQILNDVKEQLNGR